MKLRNLGATVAVSTVLGLSSALLAGEPMSEPVNMKDLPAAVQKTITEKAAGGKIARLAREDDNDGRWNYEVVVKSEGKEWGFEVAPNGDFVRKHDVAPLVNPLPAADERLPLGCTAWRPGVRKKGNMGTLRSDKGEEGNEFRHLGTTTSHPD